MAGFSCVSVCLVCAAILPVIWEMQAAHVMTKKIFRLHIDKPEESPSLTFTDLQYLTTSEVCSYVLLRLRFASTPAPLRPGGCAHMRMNA